MNQSIALLFLFLFHLTIQLNAQCPNSARLETQQEVDEFVNNYPNCDSIKSGLTIGYQYFSDPTSDITDLSGLNSLVYVGGNLIMGHLDSFVYFNGPLNITAIGGDLNLRQNGNLKDLRNFDKLTAVGERLQVYLHDSLENISHLAAIDTIGNFVQIDFNRHMTEFGGLRGVKHVSKHLTIHECPKLQNLDGLQNLKTIDGTLTITQTGLSNLDELQSLEIIDGSFSRLSIRFNPELENIHGLSNLKIIGRSLYIDDCPKLESLSPFSSLQSLGENLRISNTGVKDLDGLQNVIAADFVAILENDSLRSLTGLNLNSSLIGYLSIENNPLLRNLDGIGQVDSLLAINGGGFSGLSIRWNSSLENLDGLSGLTYVGKDVNIQSNDALRNLNGLEYLTRIDGDLRIQSNDSLFDCSSVCPLLSFGVVEEVVTVSGNLMGCNTIEEILADSCEVNVGIEDLANYAVQNLRVYPNPTEDLLEIEFEATAGKEYIIEIIALNGMPFLSQQSQPGDESIVRSTIDLSQLPDGIYCLLVKSSGGVLSRKIVVVH